MSKPVDLGSIKTGSYLLIEGEPCKIVSYDKSKPGKHGSAKARVVGIGLFDNVKRSIVSPVSANVEVPIIDKRTGQIISLNESGAQLMDMETFEIFETSIPEDPAIKNKLQNGVEVEYWRTLGRNKLIRVKN